MGFPGQELRLTAPIVKTPTRHKTTNKTTRSTHPTSQPLDKRSIDPPNPQAYVDRKENVKPQNVTSVKKPVTSVKKTSPKGFPDRVKTWMWPAEGEVVIPLAKLSLVTRGLTLLVQE